jgi:arylsulfatase A
MREARRTVTVLAAVLGACSIATVHAAPAHPPNVIFILADDLGYAELGCYGQKRIHTPHLDRLAEGGMRFTQHYSGNAVCAPSRCVLLTGRHPGHAWVRDNREAKPEGQEPLPAGTTTLAALLRQQSYATAAMGKWGLGGPGTSGDPLKQGFDRFFGYNCQRHAHNYYPTSLWDNERRIPLNNPPFSPYQKLATDGDPNAPASYAKFTGKDYAPDLIAEQARRFIRANKDRPFFLYFATTVPHLALQVPEDSLAEYRGQWPDPPYTGTNGYLPHRTPRAAYAAMVTRLDREVGRFMELVKELGLEERTMVVFTSDNGPTYDRLGGSDSGFFQSAGPFRGLKGSLYEGGIRVPLIVAWKGHVPPGTTSDRVAGFEDWLPTILELAGASSAVPRGLDGFSFAPTLLGRPQAPRPFLYREFPSYGGQQSVRVDQWKGIRQRLNPRGPQARPERRIELYDLAADPGETRDVSGQHPEMVAQIERLMREQHVPSGEFPFPALDAMTPK